MKVLQINAVCGTGSTGKICQDIYWAIKNKGYECKIVWGRRKGGNVPDIDTIQIGSLFDCYVHALNTRIFDNAGFCSRKATIRLLEQIKLFDPDVIHLHNLHGYYINIEILFDYLRGCGKKIVWTLHDCWSFTGHCSHMDFVKCNKWLTTCHDCIQKKEYPASYLLDRSSRNFTEKKALFTNINNLMLVSPSSWLKSKIEKSFLKQYPVEVIHNGVDTEIFRPRKSELKHKYGIGNKKIILCVASKWTERKGVFDIIKLSNLLPEDYVIVVIGEQDKILKKEKNNDKLIKIDRTEDQVELAEWYSLAEVFFNPTYEDTYPTVNIEAMACGTPIITYNSGGCCETVNENSIVNTGDLEEVARRIVGSQFEVIQNMNVDKRTYIKQYVELYFRG